MDPLLELAERINDLADSSLTTKRHLKAALGFIETLQAENETMRARLDALEQWAVTGDNLLLPGPK